ncbi:MAG: hypothetical protein V4506_12535 [Bacteroidota bacterium]
MTKEEVEAIYNYLHENYEYKPEGQLIRKTAPKINKNVRIGQILGSFYYQVPNSQRPCMRATIYFNNKNYTLNLSHFIYIYHHKEKPKMIKYLDENPMNNRIENLSIYSGIEREANKGLVSGSPFKTKNGETRYRYMFQIENNKNGKAGKKISFGSFETLEECNKLSLFIRNLRLTNPEITPNELKIKAMAEFPKSKMRLEKTNKLGFDGVYKRGKSFVCRCRVHGKMHTSTYQTPEEAHNAYLEIKKHHETS